MSLVFDTSLYMNGGAGGGVDQTYDPTSINAQSGTAVAQAIAGITIPTVNNATLTITQGGVSKGTFTANAGTDVTIALDSDVNIDNVTITENSSSELQASAVMNARTGTDVLPIWQGTEQQWTNGKGTDWYNWKSATYTPNFTIAGSPTIDSTTKVMSNTSSNNYIYFPTPDTRNANSLEINTKFLYREGNSTLFRGNQASFVISTDNGNNHIFINLGNGSAWTIANHVQGSNTLIEGTVYYVKLLYDGSKYELYISTNGTDWTLDWSYVTNSLIGYEDGNGTCGNGWSDIYLLETNVKKDGNVIWTPYTESGVSLVYTLDAEPTTSSTVYSAPNTSSALTITSIGTGTITLSDNNTYTYTQSGDQTTYQSIGEAHPTWLCNINGVGVKIGTTMIANKADISEYLKKHQIDTNGNYTSEFEYHTANSTEPETDVTVRYNDYFGSLRCSSVGVSLVGQARYGAHITQRGEYFVTNTPTRSGYDSYTDGLIMTKGYLVNNYPDNSSLVYNNNNDKYFLEVKGIKNSEYTDSSTTLKIWEGNSTEYTEDQQSKTYYCWREIFEGVNYDFYTSTATPQVGDMAAYKSPNGNEYQITATDGSTYIELFDGDDHADRYNEGDTTVAATIDANTLCLIEGEGVKRNGVDIATKITLDNVPTQGSTNGITSGAVYSVLGDLETALHNINSGS